MRALIAGDRRILLLLLGAPLLGLVGVLGAALVPDDTIAEHLVDGERSGLLSPQEPGPTPLGTTPAGYTECTALSVGLGDEPGDDLYTATMRSPAERGCGRLATTLDQFEQTGEMRVGYPYLRYWHGHTVLTRPAVALFGVAGTRWLAFALVAVAVGGLGATVRRYFGLGPAALLLAPTLLTTDVVIAGLSASSAIGMATAWIGGWMTLEAVRRRPNWTRAAIVAALAGCISAYADLMTTLPGAMALTATGATLGAVFAGASVPRRPLLGVTAASVVGWTSGLAWMWACKWLFASVALGFGTVVDNVRSQIDFRLSSGTDGVTDSRVRGLTVNAEEWWYQPLTPWVVVATVVVLVALVLRARRSGRGASASALTIAGCVAIIVVPVVGWYVALNNHSQIHPQLVYRSLPLALGGLAATVLVATKPPATATLGILPAERDPASGDGVGVAAGDRRALDGEQERQPA